MFERIVVGVARVETAQKAARYGIDLASKLGAELHLVTAFSGSDTGPAAPERQHAEGFLESIALSSAVPIRTHALPGDPAAAILRVAGEIGADLIVVGNKGMHGASRILGSVPNNIAHKTDCSILIVSTT
jgi:nucleotide-binding universal stress UspA family protein